MTKQEMLEFWRLKENPFDEAATRNDVNYFYRSGQHEVVIDRTINGVAELGFEISTIIGEIGTGKSFASIIIAGIINKEFPNYTALYINQSYHPYENLLCQIVNAMTQQSVANGIEATNLLKSHVFRDLKEKGKQLVLIIDECHDYTRDELEQIRQLVNHNIEQNLISLIFVGQMEALNTIKEMPQLMSRIKMSQYLNNLTEQELPEYIRKRMEAAGYDVTKGHPFLPYTREIYAATIGMPREINKFCNRMLFACAEKGDRTIRKTTFKALMKAYEEEKRAEMTRIVAHTGDSND